MSLCNPASGTFALLNNARFRRDADHFASRGVPLKRRRLASISYFALFSGVMLVMFCLVGANVYAQEPGQNVNMVSGTVWPYGDPFLERQDEPSLGVSTRNALHLLAGANDYRTVDLNLPELEVGEGPTATTTCATPPCTGEPWVGEYISTDGGARWQSTLLPGYPQDTSPQGLSSPLHMFTTAADPVIASGTNGMFYYGGIAFNRGSSLGTVFVARFMDLNNKENGDIAENSFPIRYINTVPVAYGTNSPSDFLDKPWIATDIPRGSSTCSFSVTQADGSVVQQKIPAGNVYVAYANVATSPTGVQTSTIYFSRSTNCGSTWSTPIAISKGYAISQGATIQIDPETGIVYVAWRVIHNTPTANDGIAITASLNGGQSFFPPLTVVSLPPFNLNTPTAPALFDQNTSETSFRTTAYPALAVADSGIPLIPGPLYLAWSQRGMGPNGEARIMMLAVPGNASLTPSGFKPPTPFAVDNGAVTNDIGGTFAGLNAGHQIMPMMTFNQGNLMLVYYDLRQDHTIGEFTPSATNGIFTPDANGNFFEETRDEVIESPIPPYSPYFISDAGLTVRRHTIDLVLAQSTGQGAVPKFNYVRVTHYDFGLFEGEESGETAPFHQLKFDPPNLPMFELGQGAFMGDYIGITGQPFVLVKCGNSQCWTYNNPSPPGVAGTFFAAPKPAPSSAVNYATWTSNQDVIPPPNNLWDTYTAINSGGQSVYNPSQPVPGCQDGFEGDRNQNVYMSRISQGLLVTSPQVSKPLSSSIQRGFVVLVQNATGGRSTAAGFVNYFRLTIASQPTNGFASFAQFLPASPVPNPPFPTTNNGIKFPLTSIDVAIAPHTGVARTVFAVSSSPTASILINVNEITGLGGSVLSGGMSSFLLLNADGTVPANLVDPNGQTGSNSITDVELYNPNVSAPNVSAPNVSAPNVSAPNVSAPNVSAPNVSAPNVSAPNVSAPNVSAYGVANPNVSAPNVSAPNVSAAPPSDGTFTVTNTGNTTASYNVALTGSTSTPLQLLLSQIYATPQTDGRCNLITQQQDITLANVPNVPLTPVNSVPNPNVSAAPVTEPTFSLGPGDTAYITIRGNVDIATMEQIVTQVSPVIVPQAVNSNNTTATTQSNDYPPISILTTLLPATDRNDQGYSVQLQYAGGKPGTGTWSIISGALPGGINLSPSGLISGTASSPGSYPVTIKVTDTNSPADTATQSYTLNVSTTVFTTQTVMPAPDGVVGQTYFAIPLTVMGGTPPYNFIATGLPPGLSISPSTGQITGVPTTPNPSGSTVVITATDAATPTESVSYTTAIGIGAVIQISPSTSTLPAGTIGLAYSYQLSASGGIGGLVFGPSGLPAGGTLSSGGLISFVNPQTATVTFTVSVHDQAIPTNQSQSMTYTINFAPFSSGTLNFLVGPSSTPVGQVISPAVQVVATNNADLPIQGLPITLSLNSGPGTLSGTLTQVTNASGIATFPDLSINAAGTGDILQAAAGSVSITSNPFNITSLTPQVCATTPGPLISWWPFNGNALDIRGGKPGTILGDFGTQSVFVPAEVGQGFKPTGEGVLISYPASPYLTPVNFTAGAWVRVDSETNDATEQILWQGSSSNVGFTTTPYSLGVVGNGSTPWVTYGANATIIGTAGPGKIVATFSDGTNELDMFSNTALTAGKFYYVAITWNGPSAGATIWINGVADQTSGSTALSGLLTPTNPFQIGGIQGNGVGTESFNGVIDELQIWGAGISQFELQQIYNAGSSGECQAIWFTESNGPSNDTDIGYISPDGTTIKEYSPTNAATSFPDAIVAGPDGNMWFSEQNGGQIGNFNPGTLSFNGYTLGLGEETGITSGPDGTLWFLLPSDLNQNNQAAVASISTNGNSFHSYQNFSAGYVQTSMTAGPDGNLWVTEGTEGPGLIAKVTTGGSTTEFSPTTINALGPTSITTGPDGNLWFLNGREVVAINTLNAGVVHDYLVPNGLSSVVTQGGGAGSGYQNGDVVTVVETGASGGTLQVTSVDGNGAVTGFNINSYGTGYVNTQTNAASTTGGHGTGWQVNITAASNAMTNSIALGPDGNLWFTSGQIASSSGANNIFQLTPAGQFTAFPGLPGGAPNFITAGPDGNIWFTDYLNNAIGQLTVSSGAVAEFPTPTTNSNPWGIGIGPAVVPAAPTGLMGQSFGPGSASLSWTASTGATRYNVYRSTSANGPFTLIGNTTHTTFPDSPPANNCGTNTFYYFVTAVGTGNMESGDSTHISVGVAGPC